MGTSGPNDNWPSYRNLDSSCAAIDRYFKEFFRCHEWHSIMFRKLLREERGNVESALVLIPLVLLFLCAAQLVTAILYRNASLIDLQNQASKRAISAEFIEGDRTLVVASPDQFNDLDLIVVNQRRSIPMLVPGLQLLLGKRFEIDLKGVAVMER